MNYWRDEEKRGHKIDKLVQACVYCRKRDYDCILPCEQNPDYLKMKAEDINTLHEKILKIVRLEREILSLTTELNELKANL